jgi:acetyl-CoA/propionyl-CoA carboxylase biotin carboxyl carrier protein
MPTIIPFHRAVLEEPAFTAEPFAVHTRWIETEFDNTIEPYAGGPAEAPAKAERERVTVEVGGRRLEVVLPGDLTIGRGGGGGGGTKRAKPASARRTGGTAAVSGDTLTAPMQGTIVKVAVEEGQQVAEGELVVVLEAMKMEQPITAHKSGTISGLTADVGAPVQAGAAICRITD